jgi:hypothetical protein
MVGIDRNAEEGKTPRVLPEELLPPGQLTAALSPARPHKDEEPAAEKVLQPNRPSVEGGQGDRQQPISDGEWRG